MTPNQPIQSHDELIEFIRPIIKDCGLQLLDHHYFAPVGATTGAEIKINYPMGVIIMTKVRVIEGKIRIDKTFVPAMDIHDPESIPALKMALYQLPVSAYVIQLAKGLDLLTEELEDTSPISNLY